MKSVLMVEMEMGPDPADPNYLQAVASMPGSAGKVMVASISCAVVESSGPAGYKRWRELIKELFLEFMNANHMDVEFEAQPETKGKI